jgi:CubicO group peptidase (beta-lactamase class C family)
MKVLPLLLVALCTGLRADDVDRYVEAQIESHHLPGLALAVLRNGEVVKMKGYGFADLEQRTTATPQTVYLLASVTKQFTATAVMLLVQDGKIGLDDKIGAYLDIPAAWSGITVRHLLNHTSGLARTPPIGRVPGWFYTEHSRDEYIKLSASLPLQFHPGEKFSYSNVGYVLLGYIVEKASGKSYWDFLHDRIFQPLGMNATRNGDPQTLIPNRAGAYGWERNMFVNRIHPTSSTGFSAGCLVSTAEDMAKWDAALRTEKLLSQAALAQIWTPGRLSSGAETGYGFGWTVGDSLGHRTVSHSGAFEGASTFITRFLDDHLSVIVLINRDQADAAGIGNHIAALYIPGLQPVSSAPQADPDPARTSRLKRLAGDIGTSGDSPDLTPGAKTWLQSGLPWIKGAAPMLRNPEQFTFLRCDATVAGKLERNGSAVTDLCQYRLAFRGHAVDWSFYLTADGRVAALGPQR